MSDEEGLVRGPERILREWGDQPAGTTGRELREELLRAMLLTADKQPGRLNAELPGWIDSFRRRSGLQNALNLIKRIEAALGLRRPEIGIYDNALHFIGGAQKYGCTIAAALQDDFDVTFIANADVALEQLQEWYGLDLSRCRIRTVPIPFFAEQETGRGVFDAGMVDLKGSNPFHVISMESGLYDVFVNNCMLEMVYPLAGINEFVCHFPEREISRFFHVARYHHIIYNSRYTAEWIEKRWRIEAHTHIYPPVDMEGGYQPDLKRNQILSVSRFELSGNKQQMEMLKAFASMIRENPREMEGWRLVLAGGSTRINPYLERVRRMAAALPAGRVEILVDLSARKLRELYGRSRIFWHLSGLDQVDPARVEHFGMTTVEAMQNGVVPVVFRGGGQMEIVEEGVSGRLFENRRDLKTKTLDLLANPGLMEQLAEGAVEKSRLFSKAVFFEKIREHFKKILM